MPDSRRCTLTGPSRADTQSEERESGGLWYLSDHAMPTKITVSVLEDSTHCTYKAYLRLNGQCGITSDYEEIHLEARSALTVKAQKKIIEQHRDCKIGPDIALTPSLLKQGASFIIGAILRSDALSIRFDALMKLEGQSDLGHFHYIPVLFHEHRRINKAQRLLLEMCVLLLFRVQGKSPKNAVVYHGSDCTTTTVRLKPRSIAAEALLDEVVRMQQGGAGPKLLLNDHCQVCEFRQRCHAQAVKEDSLSLLRGLGEKEIKAYGRKGLFTLTQLAHTFRPRRKGKRSERGSKHRYHALQALAIRDNTVYVLGTPELPAGPVCIYLDAEGGDT